MTLIEAYAILEVDKNTSNTCVKENYRWLVKFYHPDNTKTSDPDTFRRVIEAYKIVNKDREDEYIS